MRRLAIVLLLCLAALGTAANFVTERFDSDVEVRPDGSLSITETIAIRFTVPQRGLIRRLPFRTTGPEGQVREVGYYLEGVTFDTGRGPVKAPAIDRLQGSEWQVRIGDPNRTLSGPVTYRLSYSVQWALTRTGIPPRIELFWNVLPLDWATSIPASTVRIRWPQTSEAIRARFLVGESGSRRGIELRTSEPVIGRQDLLAGKLEATAVTVQTKSALAKGQAMTAIVALPDNLVSLPPPKISTAPAPPVPAPIKSNPLGALIPLLVPVSAFWMTRKRHRPRKTPLTVRFDAPPGITPSEAGLLIDESFQPRDTVANIISLAQKGAIRLIASQDEDVPATIEILSSPPKKPLAAVEEDLLARLAARGTVIPPEALRGSFAADYSEHGLRHWNCLEDRGLLHPNSSGRSCRTDGLLGIFTLIAGLCSCVFLGPWGLVGMLIAGIASVFVALRVSGITSEGWKVRRELEGLREFINRANRTELEAMSAREPAQALFERLLPYAVAFGAAKVWTKAFDGLNLAPPEWYSDPSGTMMHAAFWSDFAGGGFEQSWGDAVSYVPTPTGSGFSSGDSGFGGSYDSSSGSFDGGGSVGDGGGGGGGDSW